MENSNHIIVNDGKNQVVIDLKEPNINDKDVVHGNCLVVRRRNKKRSLNIFN